MRIAIVYLGRKGAGPVYSLEFTRALLEEGVEILCVISTYSENLADWEHLYDTYKKTGRIDLIKVKTYQSASQFLFKTLEFWHFLQINRKVRGFHPDIVLSTMVHPWHNILFLLLKNKCRRIKIIHDVIPHEGERNLFYRSLNYWDIHTSDCWITLTQVAKKKLMMRGIDGKAITVIPHAHFGSYNKNNLGITNDSINYRMGFFGRIHKYKGLELLLQAYRNLYLKMPQLKLLIAGSGDLADCDVEEGDIEIHNRWIADDEIVDLLMKVDIVVLPYIEASQSGVIPLAFSLGKPVIATNVGGLSEQVPSNCGLIVEPNNSKVIEKAVLSLYKDPLKIKRMGESAFQYAHKQLSWKKSASLFLSSFSPIN